MQITPVVGPDDEDSEEDCPSIGDTSIALRDALRYRWGSQRDQRDCQRNQSHNLRNVTPAGKFGVLDAAMALLMVVHVPVGSSVRKAAFTAARVGNSFLTSTTWRLLTTAPVMAPSVRPSQNHRAKNPASPASDPNCFLERWQSG